MRDLRFLVAYVFFGGLFFDSFLSSAFEHDLFMGIVFAVLTVTNMTQALKLYDKIKVIK